MGAKLRISIDNNEENSFLLLQFVGKRSYFLEYIPKISTKFANRVFRIVDGFATPATNYFQISSFQIVGTLC